MAPQQDQRARSGRLARLRPDPEAGGALVFVMVLAASFLFIAGLSITVGLHSRRSSAQRLHGKAAQFCAELALERARPVVAANKGSWDAVLAGGTGGWHPVIGACPGTGGYTYSVTIRDNADDSDQQSDKDSIVIVDAVALHGGVPVAQVTGVVQEGGTDLLSDYKHQAGEGARKTGNKM